MTTLIDFRPALRALLLSNSTLSTMVGGSRIYPGQLPQGQTATSIVYNQVSDVGDYASAGPTGLAQQRFQIDAWAQSAGDASTLGLLVKETLDGYRGTVLFGSDSPQDSVVVRGMFMDAGRAIFDDPSLLHGQSRDFIIWFAER